MHELPSELDPFVDRRRGHSSGFELLVKLLRVPRGDLIDLDPRWHEFFEVRYHLFPYRDGGWLATLALALDVAIEERIERWDNYLLRNRFWLDQTHGEELFSQRWGFG